MIFLVFFLKRSVLIILFSAVSAIDTSGVSFFKDLRRVLDKKSLEASHQVFSLHHHSFSLFFTKIIDQTIYQDHFSEKKLRITACFSESYWRGDGEIAAIRWHQWANETRYSILDCGRGSDDAHVHNETTCLIEYLYHAI